MVRRNAAPGGYDGRTGVTRDAWGSGGSELSDPAQPPALSRGTVDRAAEHRSDAAWVAEQWRTRGRVLRLAPDGSTPVTRSLRLDLSDVADLSDAAHLADVADLSDADHLADGAGPADGLGGIAATAGPPPGAVLLGVDDDGAYFAVGVEAPLRGARGLRELGAVLADRDAGLLTTAVALAQWHRTHTHCPRCGTPTVLEAAGWTTRCPADGSSHFPRTDPAVIMLVVSPDGERAVLGRQPSWPTGRYSCLAGFVEPGESAEQAVVRESAEESGLTVRDVRPAGSQPWPFPASLMLAFTAVADDDVDPHGADEELEDVRWFTRREARDDVLLPPPVSIANRLIAAWLLAG